MAVFTIPATAIVANVQKNSPGQALAASVKNVLIQLNDTNGQWGTVVGHIKQWGVQKSADGGANWTWGPVWQGDPTDTTQWIAFGTLGKNGLPPALNISSTGLVQAAGDQVRLSILTDTNITLGATITVT